MYDTHVTIVGNALHDPEWRRTATGASVTTFKIASTSRRLDRASGKWIDGNSLRVRVVCWRNLAVNVARSVTRGDPLIVTGRLYTRDWKDGEVVRTQYELEALAVGHDLTRGRALFERIKPRTATSEIEDDASAQRIGGEVTEPIPPREAPARFDDTPYEVLERELAEAAAAAPPRTGREVEEVDAGPGAPAEPGRGVAGESGPEVAAGPRPEVAAEPGNEPAVDERPGSEADTEPGTPDEPTPRRTRRAGALV